jgi:hypothetical protein
MSTPRIVDGDVVRDAAGDLELADDDIDEEIAFYLTTGPRSFFGDAKIGNSAVRVLVLNARSIVEIRDGAKRALRPMVDRGDIANVVVTPAPVIQNGTAINFYTVSYEKTGVVRR